MPNSSQDPNEIHVPFSRIAEFIKRHVHDFRNSLNSNNLEVAYLLECISDPDLVESLSKIQSEIQQMEQELRELSKKISTPYPASDLTSSKLFRILWQEVQSTTEALPALEIESCEEDVMLLLDVDDYLAAITEILKNTAQHQSRSAKLRLFLDTSKLQHVTRFEEIVTQKVDTQEWGSRPFVANSRGKLGLGLFMASRLIQANEGEMRFDYDAETQCLATEIRFPVQPTA